MLFEDLLEVIVILSSEYVLIFLEDISLFRLGIGFELLLNFFVVLLDLFSLLEELLLMFLLALLLLFPLESPLLNLFSSQF